MFVCYGVLLYMILSPKETGAAIMPMDTSVDANFGTFPKSPRGTVLDMSCQHVAAFTIQKTRGSWLTQLQTKCTNKSTISIRDKCMHVGFAGIKEADNQASRIVFQNCMRAAKHASGVSLPTMAMSVIAGIFTESDKITANLETIYKDVYNVAKHQSAPLEEKDKNRARNTVIDVWCLHLAEADVQSNLRFFLVTKFLDACKTPRMSVAGTNKCMEVGAANISEIAHRSQINRTQKCVKFVTKVPSKSLVEVGAAVAAFQNQGFNATRGKASDAPSFTRPDSLMDTLKPVIQGAITSAHLEGLLVQAEFEEKFAKDAVWKSLNAKSSNMSTGMIFIFSFMATMCGIMLIARRRLNSSAGIQNTQMATDEENLRVE